MERFDNTSRDGGGRGCWPGPRLNLLGKTFTGNGSGGGGGGAYRITQLTAEVF